MIASLLAVQESTRQTTFRALLKALSYPGRPVTCAGLPAPLVFHFFDTVLTQTDGFYIADAIEYRSEIAESLTRRVGARPLPPQASSAAAIPASEFRTLLPDLHRGSLEYPDEGATVALQVEHIDRGNDGIGIELIGPGVAGRQACAVGGLVPEDIEALMTANQAFPCGIDTILVDPEGTIVGIPRSVRVRVI